MKHTKKGNKKLLLILFIILFIFFIFILNKFNKNLRTNINTENNSAETTLSNKNTKQDTAEPITFTLTSLGDTLCHNTQYWDAYNSKTDEYDFSYVYEDIKNYTLSSDITIGSLETTFAGKEKGYSNYPTFNTPDSLATALKDIGVDVVSLAGNHALDYGYTGLCRTIDVFNNIGLSHLGTYKTAEDQEKILIKDVKGVKIAFINYTYGTNGIPLPSGKDFCVNLIDKDFIKKQIQKNFQYYLYQRNGITSKIRLSQIYYVESLRHQIILHSINGEMIERKTLSQFIKEIQSLDFIQIHKSYVVNKQFIQEVKNQEVILKEQTHLPIGRSYKESLKEQD